MKKFRFVLAGLFTAALLACPASAMSFPDVDRGADYAAAVEYVSEAGAMVGDSQGRFNPDKTVSRAEMAAIVCRVLDQAENLSASNVFTDVPAAHWANPYIGKASETGIVGGYGGGKFGPDDPVTFEQAVTMIVRAIGEGEKAVAYGGYPDGFLQTAREKDLLKGIQAEQGQGMSRSSVAVLLYNYSIAQNNSAFPEDGHTHNYIEKAVPGSGHYEQVQTGTKWVQDYTTVIEYECGNCHWKTTDREAFECHTGGPGYSLRNAPCPAAHYYFTEKKVANGTHEEPVYENQWVEDTIRVCSVCGQQEP